MKKLKNNKWYHFDRVTQLTTELWIAFSLQQFYELKERIEGTRGEFDV